ncbi:MAG TPA: DUF6090 family protein [Rhodanobacteraceae bacterium]|nr:DUF6090 family protein [Rhodanobacteraceae bacterium]
MLRHVISHLRRQDWAAVVIELIVVVVGVFIGVQASNWNENRETNQKAAVFTERLKSDLREEAWSYEYEVGYFNEVLTSAKRAADALSGKAPLSDEALLVAAYRATQYRYNIRRRATYDELTSTGEIGLIRDPALRDLAMRLYTAPMFDSIHTEGTDNPYRKAFRIAIPYEVQNALESACGDHLVPTGDYKAIGHSLDYPCSPHLSPGAMAPSAAILRSDPHFLEFLRLRIADIETNLGNLTVFYGGIREGLRAVAKEKP